MYVWLWRKLPGTAALKAAQCLALFLLICAVLLFAGGRYRLPGPPIAAP